MLILLFHLNAEMVLKASKVQIRNCVGKPMWYPGASPTLLYPEYPAKRRTLEVSNVLTVFNSNVVCQSGASMASMKGCPDSPKLEWHTQQDST